MPTFSFAHGPFDNVQRIDMNPVTGNLLFRGSAPIRQDQFDYTGLVNRIKTIYPRLPTHFKLVVINLIGGRDQSVLTKEQTFFKHHKNKGQVLSWPVYGLPSQPINPLWFHIPGQSNNTALLAMNHTNPNSPYYGIALAQSLKTMMNTHYSTPHVFYIHCSIGCDRTGELATIYTMLNNQDKKHIGPVLAHYLQHHDIKACYGRYSDHSTLNAIRWACFYFANRHQNTASPWMKYLRYYAQCRYLTAYSRIRTLHKS